MKSLGFKTQMLLHAPVFWLSLQLLLCVSFLAHILQLMSTLIHFPFDSAAPFLCPWGLSLQLRAGGTPCNRQDCLSFTFPLSPRQVDISIFCRGKAGGRKARGMDARVLQGLWVSLQWQEETAQQRADKWLICGGMLPCSQWPTAGLCWTVKAPRCRTGRAPCGPWTATPLWSSWGTARTAACSWERATTPGSWWQLRGESGPNRHGGDTLGCFVSQWWAD